VFLQATLIITLKNLQDAFVSKGVALSNTYDGYSPTLRIDVILMSPHFKTEQYYSPRIYASDHFPVVADLQLVH
jgi:endonuclease/exonuclease/phosphatase family metal-dependent hydrolase